MYICKECGTVFEDFVKIREIHDELDGSPSETFEVCPECGGGFEEAKLCLGCFEWHYEAELYDGRICQECLLDLLTAENFFQFATSCSPYEDSVDILEEFVFDELFEIPEATPRFGSGRLRKAMVKEYNEARKEIGEAEFLRRIREFMSADVDAREDFACWMKKQKK